AAAVCAGRQVLHLTRELGHLGVREGGDAILRLLRRQAERLQLARHFGAGDHAVDHVACGERLLRGDDLVGAGQPGVRLEGQADHADDQDPAEKTYERRSHLGPFVWMGWGRWASAPHFRYGYEPI